ASARRRSASGGPHTVWWPALPSHRLTSLTTCPPAHHLAAVPPALMSASSGWAPIDRIRTGRPVTRAPHLWGQVCCLLLNIRVLSARNASGTRPHVPGLKPACTRVDAPRARFEPAIRQYLPLTRALGVMPPTPGGRPK